MNPGRSVGKFEGQGKAVRQRRWAANGRARSVGKEQQLNDWPERRHERTAPFRN